MPNGPTGYGGGGYGGSGGYGGGDSYSSNKYDDDWGGLKNVDYNSIQTTRIQKDFYKEDERTANRSRDEIHSWRQKHDIHIEDPNCNFRPVMEFSELNIPNELSELFKKNNYVNPTPIQAQSWPISLQIV